MQIVETMLRRTWMMSAVGAGLAVGTRRVQAKPAKLPTTIAQVLARLPTLMSSQNVAAIATASESELQEYVNGIWEILDRRWQVTPWRGISLSLAVDFLSYGIPTAELGPYLVTALCRQQRGMALNMEEQLRPFRERERQKKAKSDEYWRRCREGRGPCQNARNGKLVLLDNIYFPRNSDTAAPDQQKLMEAIAATVKGSPTLLAVEVQAHAEVGERDGRALSSARARAVVKELLNRGVRDNVLTAHGLTDEYPELDPKRRTRPGPDRRAEFLIMRRALSG